VIRGRAWPWILALAVVLAIAVARSRSAPTGGGGAPASPAGADARRFWECYQRAQRSRAAGRLEEAIALYDEALRRRPDHEDALYYRGNCAADLRRWPEAVRSYERLIAVNPAGSSRGYMQLGLLHASLDEGAPHDLPRAERHFRDALAVDPDSGAVLALGEVALLRGDRAAARARLGDASSGDPMSVAAPYLLGYLAWESGHEEEAWRLFRLAVSRGEPRKPMLKWTEEGDVKADPALRWAALARQSVTGRYWIRLRAYVQPPGPSPRDMATEYARLGAALPAEPPGGRRSGS
jgi:tetratricopeptide (TPR) repeat protein